METEKYKPDWRNARATLMALKSEFPKFSYSTAKAAARSGRLFGQDVEACPDPGRKGHNLLEVDKVRAVLSTVRDDLPDEFVKQIDGTPVEFIAMDMVEAKPFSFPAMSIEHWRKSGNAPGVDGAFYYRVEHAWGNLRPRAYLRKDQAECIKAWRAQDNIRLIDPNKQWETAEDTTCTAGFLARHSDSGDPRQRKDEQREPLAVLADKENPKGRLIKTSRRKVRTNGRNVWIVVYWHDDMQSIRERKNPSDGRMSRREIKKEFPAATHKDIQEAERMGLLKPIREPLAPAHGRPTMTKTYDRVELSAVMQRKSLPRPGDPSRIIKIEHVEYAPQTETLKILNSHNNRFDYHDLTKMRNQKGGIAAFRDKEQKYFRNKHGGVWLYSLDDARRHDVSTGRPRDDDTPIARLLREWQSKSTVDRTSFISFAIAQGHSEAAAKREQKRIRMGKLRKRSRATNYGQAKKLKF